MASGARVYVHNLPWDTTNEQLANFMSSAGAVKMASIMTRRDGRSKGCAIVEYNSPAEAGQAIASLNDAELSGRKILVREDREITGEGAPEAAPRAPRPTRATGAPTRGAARGGRGAARAPRPAPAATSGGNGTSLFVGSLAWSVTWKELKDAFASFNPVHADVMMLPNGRSKGWGLVRFATAEEAQAAIAAMQGVEINGRAIEVREDTKGQ